MNGLGRQTAKIAFATSWICGGLVSGIGGVVAPGEEDGALVITGWVCVGAGIWLLVQIWREPFGGGCGRHSSHAPSPVRRDFGLWVAGAAGTVFGAGAVMAAVLNRDLVMLGMSIVAFTTGVLVLALTRPR